MIGNKLTLWLSMSLGEFLASHHVEDLKIKYDQLGSIKVEVWRKNILSTNRGAEEQKSQALEAVPEKVLKGRALTLRSRQDRSL